MRYIPPVVLQSTRASACIQGGPAKSDIELVDSEAPHMKPGTPPAYEADE
jgi:hypothetical protein